MPSKERHRDFADYWAREHGYDEAVFLAEVDSYAFYYMRYTRQDMLDSFLGSPYARVTDGKQMKIALGDLDDFIRPILRKKLEELRKKD